MRNLLEKSLEVIGDVFMFIEKYFLLTYRFLSKIICAVFAIISALGLLAFLYEINSRIPGLISLIASLALIAVPFVVLFLKKQIDKHEAQPIFYAWSEPAKTPTYPGENGFTFHFSVDAGAHAVWLEIIDLEAGQKRRAYKTLHIKFFPINLILPPKGVNPWEKTRYENKFFVPSQKYYEVINQDMRVRGQHFVSLTLKYWDTVEGKPYSKTVSFAPGIKRVPLLTENQNQNC